MKRLHSGIYIRTTLCIPYPVWSVLTKSLEKLTHNVTSVYTDGRDAITNFTRTKQVFPGGLKAQTGSA